MDQNTLLVIFVVLAALAMIIQAAMLIGMFVASRALQKKIIPLLAKIDAVVPKVEALVPKVDALLTTSRETIQENRVKIAEITAKANDIMDSATKQVRAVEVLLGDASNRTRRQFDHAEIVLDDAMERAQETVAVVHQGIMKPLRGIVGVVAGLKAGLDFLVKGGRPSPDQVTVDEEMFI